MLYMKCETVLGIISKELKDVKNRLKGSELLGLLRYLDTLLRSDGYMIEDDYKVLDVLNFHSKFYSYKTDGLGKLKEVQFLVTDKSLGSLEKLFLGSVSENLELQLSCAIRDYFNIRPRGAYFG